MELSNKRWPDEEFFAEREKVLSFWPTGKEIDLEETVDYLKSLPPVKQYARVIVAA